MNDIKPPFFTVVIPTFNRSELLREAIQSVLKQTFDDFELLVVDDHSTDNTREIVASFGDGRIKYILNDRNRGGAGTRNAGIFKAKGHWVAFLDDDDVWLARKLEVQYEKAQQVDHTVGLIYSGFVHNNLQIKKKMGIHIPEKEGWIQNDLLYDNCIGTYSTVSVRTKLLKNLNGLDEGFPALQDRELYFRLARGSKVAFVREPLVYVRRSHRNRLSSNLQNKLAGNQLFFKKYEKLIAQNYRLRHIWASRIFLYAALQFDIEETLKRLLWTFSGLFLDPPHFIKTFGRLLVLLYKRKTIRYTKN